MVVLGRAAAWTRACWQSPDAGTRSSSYVIFLTGWERSRESEFRSFMSWIENKVIPWSILSLIEPWKANDVRRQYMYIFLWSTSALQKRISILDDSYSRSYPLLSELEGTILRLLKTSSILRCLVCTVLFSPSCNNFRISKRFSRCYHMKCISF